MKFLLTLTFIAAAVAAPQGYSLPSPSGPSLGAGSCDREQVRGADGGCVTAQVNSRVFLFDAPSIPVAVSRPRIAPKPKVQRNIVFVRLPEGGQGSQPVVVPPPIQEHVVYVLNKQSAGDQQTIEIPAPPPSDPEVYFVNYAEGDNPSLPFGVDLQTALSSASQGSGHVVDDGGSGDSFVGGVGIGNGIEDGSGGVFTSELGSATVDDVEGGIGEDSGSASGGGIGGADSPSTNYGTP